jgi:tetratricopeptide (TPR) repeat protein
VYTDYPSAGPKLGLHFGGFCNCEFAEPYCCRWQALARFRYGWPMPEHPISKRQDAPGPVERTRWLLGALVITLACFAVYAPALRGGLVWDDDTHLLDNPVFDEDGLYKVWLTPPERINYWPLTFTTYWIEYQFWGFEPTGYHVVNVLLHAIAAIVLWAVLRALALPLPWLAALVFAVHPVNVESVAWIAQRKNILSLLFFVVAALFYLRFEVSRKLGLYVAAVASFAMAMLSKGAAAPFPAILLLFAWWRRGTITRTDVMHSLPFFFVTIATSLLELSTQVLVADDIVVRGDGFIERLAGAGWVVWFYLSKVLVPVGLNFVYPLWKIDATASLTWVPLLAGAGLLATAWWYRGGWGRPVLVALLFYIVMLSPVLGFFDIYYMRFSYVADHYQYLAMMGITALVICGGGALVQTRTSIPLMAKRAIAVLVVVGCGGTSAALSASYQSSERLWRDTIAKNPEASLAHYNLAHDLQDEGRLDEAQVHYEQTLRIQPNNAQAANNLGKVQQDQGQPVLAIAAYRRAIRADTKYIDPLNNLAVLLQQQGDLQGAQEQFEAALSIAPESAVLHFNYARLLTARGANKAAIKHHQRAVALEPSSQQMRAGLARALQRSAPRGDVSSEQ